MNCTHLTQAVSTSGGGISEVVRALSMAQQDAGDQPRVLSVEDDGEAIGPWPAGSPEFLSACHFPGMIVLPDMDERLDQINPRGAAHPWNLELSFDRSSAMGPEA